MRVSQQLLAALLQKQLGLAQFFILMDFSQRHYSRFLCWALLLMGKVVENSWPLPGAFFAYSDDCFNQVLL